MVARQYNHETTMADEDLAGADFEDSEIDDDDGEVPWESHAREAIERVLAEATFDEIRGVIYAPTRKTIAATRLSKGSIRLTSS